MARRRLSLPETIERCQAKLAADPRSPAFAQLADAFRKQGRLEEAIATCEQGLHHCPNYSSAYMVLGRAQHEKGDLEAAREAFQWVLQINPESVQALKFLGQIADARNEIPDALASYRMALIFYPHDKEVRARVARLEAQSVTEEETGAPEMAPVPQEPAPREAHPAGPEEESTLPEAEEELRAQPPAPVPEHLVTETMAALYAAQGLHDRAADIYGRLAAESPEREDLAEKYRQSLAHLEEKPGRHAFVSRETVLGLLETWRDAFRHLRRREKVSVVPPEARRVDARPRARSDKGPVRILETWRDAFRHLRRRERISTEVQAMTTAPSPPPGHGHEDTVGILEAWRDAFRRVKEARQGGTR